MLVEQFAFVGPQSRLSMFCLKYRYAGAMLVLVLVLVSKR